MTFNLSALTYNQIKYKAKHEAKHAANLAANTRISLRIRILAGVLWVTKQQKL